jgi:signal transduction histidine kinase
MVDAVSHALATGDTDGAATISARALEVIRETAVELRGIVRGLDPVDLEELGLAAALAELAERTLGRRGTHLTLDLEGAPATGSDAASGLFQIAREALEQAERRGPPAAARLALTESAHGGALLVIADDAAPERRQAVTDGLAERATELNGTFTTTREGTRTIVRVELPPSATLL